MGWDSTMSSDYKNNDRIFDIEICGNHYKTSSSNIVFQYDDIKMCSAATRIYKAYRANDMDMEEKEELIIKDYWPTDYLDTEDVRLKEMLGDIADPLERELVERSILTPISCERVKVNDREDHTRETILRGESPNMSYKIILPGERGEKGTYSRRNLGNRGVNTSREWPNCETFGGLGETRSISSYGGELSIDTQEKKGVPHQWSLRQPISPLQTSDVLDQ